MADRYVRQRYPILSEEDARSPLKFSDYEQCPNIVLLGDPGSGKTFLFENFSKYCPNGFYLKVRNFLNSPIHDSDGTFFLDGLDEKRSGRYDNNIVDEIVRKFFEVIPKKIRISCRMHDWLEGTDLEAFKYYFGLHGDCVVLSLEPLTYEEQLEVLISQNVTDPAVFISDAAKHGVDDLLKNPQTLIMLWQVVAAGDWPNTRSELFRKSLDILLLEHNTIQTPSMERVFNSSELLNAAGTICASRLIGDIEGISLLDNESNFCFPSYRSIGRISGGLDEIRSVLGRRLFKGTHSEKVDYIHRTIAEYVGAQWLAKLVNSGFPIRRILALIWVNGYPTSELRGLNAWLAVFLPEHAYLFIDADPYGVLLYGDVAGFSVTNKRRLLNALAQLSEENPYFRAKNWCSPVLGTLSCKELATEFSACLKSAKTNYVLKSLILDILIFGVPILSLEEDLFSIAFNVELNLQERSQALEALLKMGEKTRSSIIKIYKGKLRNDPSEIAFRKIIMSEFFEEVYSPGDLVSLLQDAVNCKDRLEAGIFYLLSKRLPLTDISIIMDCFEEMELNDPMEQPNGLQVFRFFDQILLRLFKEDPLLISPFKLLRWLKERNSFQYYDSYGETNEIRNELKKNLQLHSALIEITLDEIVIDGSERLLVYKFSEITLRAISAVLFLDHTLKRVLFNKDEVLKQIFLFQLALNDSFHFTSHEEAIFETLLKFAKDRDDLMEVWNKSKTCVLDEAFLKRMENRTKRISNDKKIREKVIADFKKNKVRIVSGEDLCAMSWIAHVYFAFSSDIDRKATPHERLQNVLGDDAQIALDGLIALISGNDIPSLDTFTQTFILKNKQFNWWYAILAGIDEHWLRTKDLNGLPDTLLSVGLAIDLLMPTLFYEDNVSRPIERPWKNYLFANRPKFVNDIYLHITRININKKPEYSYSLQLLQTNADLASFLKENISVLLNEFPNMAVANLKNILPVALKFTEIHEKLLLIIQDVLDGSLVLKDDNKNLYLVAGYLVFPEKFEQIVLPLAMANVEFVWLFRDLINSNIVDSTKQTLKLNSSQKENLIRLIAKHFPSCSSREGWSEAESLHGGNEFARSLIYQLSSDPSVAASEALGRLVKDKLLETYSDEIKYAFSNQQVIFRNSVPRPTWEATINTLSKSTPANIADLHALIGDHLENLKKHIAFGNTNIYKRFWNENSYESLIDPKSETSGRNVIVDLLRLAMAPLGIFVEPEGHLRANKRIDIAIYMTEMRGLIEIKRHYHRDVWTALEEQLDRYTRDPYAKGFGIYCVLWFGVNKERPLPRPPEGRKIPKNVCEMEQIIKSLIPPSRQHQLSVVVIDVSGELVRNFSLCAT